MSARIRVFRRGIETILNPATIVQPEEPVETQGRWLRNIDKLIETWPIGKHRGISLCLLYSTRGGELGNQLISTALAATSKNESLSL